MSLPATLRRHWRIGLPLLVLASVALFWLFTWNPATTFSDGRITEIRIRSYANTPAELAKRTGCEVSDDSKWCVLSGDALAQVKATLAAQPHSRFSFDFPRDMRVTSLHVVLVSFANNRFRTLIAFDSEAPGLFYGISGWLLGGAPRYVPYYFRYENPALFALLEQLNGR